MQTRLSWRACALPLVLLVAACSSADNPYARLKGPPLIQGQLHTVTLASDTEAVLADVEKAGLAPVNLPPNYQQADAIEAALWGVPEPVAAKVRHFRGTSQVPDVRVLVMPLAAFGRQVEPEVDQAFFRGVLGVKPPLWPLPGKQPDNVRVQAWTYLVPNILDASKRLRENGIPVTYAPVSITTSYLGTFKMLGIRAPDGTVIQLVEAVAQ